VRRTDHVLDRRPLERELDNLRHACDQAGVERAFVTAASPGVIALFLENHHYPTHEQYVAALGAAMRPEYEAIHRAGFLLQIDAPDLAMARHMSFAGATLHDFRRAIAMHLEVLDAALADIPPNGCACTCAGELPRTAPSRRPARGHRRSRGARPPGRALLRRANPRHAHEWDVWRSVRLPDDKVLIPGVLDTTTNYVEHPDLVAERILRFVEVVGAERVQAGTDCGFGTFAGMELVDPAIAWAKLDALVEARAGRGCSSHIERRGTSSPPLRERDTAGARGWLAVVLLHSVAMSAFSHPDDSPSARGQLVSWLIASGPCVRRA